MSVSEDARQLYYLIAPERKKAGVRVSRSETQSVLGMHSVNFPTFSIESEFTL